MDGWQREMARKMRNEKKIRNMMDERNVIGIEEEDGWKRKKARKMRDKKNIRKLKEKLD